MPENIEGAPPETGGCSDMRSSCFPFLFRPRFRGGIAMMIPPGNGGMLSKKKHLSGMAEPLRLPSRKGVFFYAQGGRVPSSGLGQGRARRKGRSCVACRTGERFFCRTGMRVCLRGAVSMLLCRAAWFCAGNTERRRRAQAADQKSGTARLMERRRRKAGPPACGPGFSVND